MKRYFPIIFVLLSMTTRGQKVALPSTPPPLHPTIVAFLKDYPYETELESEVFRKEQQLILSDTGFKIISYSVSWNIDLNSGIYIGTASDNKILLRSENEVPILATGANVAFDLIRVKKNDSIYTVIPFVVKIVTPEQAAKSRKDLAFCDIRIAGRGAENPDMVYSHEFRDGFTIRLSDPSYELESFTLDIENPDSELMSTRLTNPQITIETNTVTKLLRSLRPGAIVLISNAKANKKGHIYNVRPFIIYVR
jgi:hypothetical protein